MTHLDEGTIHAWLDGALDEAQSAEVGKHAASCAECGALVAEARGLIAGASRILTSLDDVPGVVPKRAPAIAPARAARRYWQAAPWVTGIAAALVLAIGVKEWRERPSAKAAFERTLADSLRAIEAQRSVAALQSEARPLDSALRTAERRVLQPVTPPAPLRETRQREAAVASGAGAGGATRADAAGDLAATATRDMKKAVVEAPKVVATEPAPAAAAGAMAMESARMPDPEVRLAGCYRLEPIVPTPAPAQAKARAAADRAPARNLAPSVAAAPVPPTAADFTAPSLLRLDTARSAQGRAVLSATTGQVVGSWRAVGTDSVRVVLLYAGAQVLSTPNRIACSDSVRSRP